MYRSSNMNGNTDGGIDWSVGYGWFYDRPRLFWTWTPWCIFFLAFLLHWNYNSDMHVHYFLYYVIQKKT